jgi:hypothetical protein
LSGRLDSGESSTAPRRAPGGDEDTDEMPRIPDFPVSGGCACGAVRYRLLEDAVELHACHCTDCQTATGSAFVMSMMVKRGSVEVERGEPKRFEFDGPDGRHHIDQRCPRCAARLWSESRSIPDLLILRPGTLDDTSWCEPVSHIWTRSAQPWVTIPEHTLNYGQQPTNDEVMAAVRAWRSRAKDPTG